MCLCQINELPLPSRGKAPNVLQAQCPSQESSSPSNWLLRLHLLRQQKKTTWKITPEQALLYLTCQESRTNAPVLLHMYVYQTKGLQTVNAVSFRCCNSFQTICCSSTVVSIGSPTFLFCLGLNSQREASLSLNPVPRLVTKPTEKWNIKEQMSWEQWQRTTSHLQMCQHISYTTS